MIKEYALELKLANTKNNYQEMIKEAQINDIGYEAFLESVLKSELELRKDNKIRNRFRYARFPYRKGLEEYDLEQYESETRVKIKRVMSLEFIEKKENILLIGNPGVGKTHLAIGLGVKACLLGKSVLFMSVPNLMIEIKEAMNLSEIKKYKRNFEKYDLVILDELGYISFEKEASEILFNLLSSRNDKGSIIITSNLTFERWNEVFKDEVLTTAIIDRLAHKSHLLDLSGESYRAKETMEWIKENKKEGEENGRN